MPKTKSEVETVPVAPFAHVNSVIPTSKAKKVEGRIQDLLQKNGCTLQLTKLVFQGGAFAYEIEVVETPTT